MDLNLLDKFKWQAVFWFSAAYRQTFFPNDFSPLAASKPQKGWVGLDLASLLV